MRIVGLCLGDGGTRPVGVVQTAEYAVLGVQGRPTGREVTGVTATRLRMGLRNHRVCGIVKKRVKCPALPPKLDNR